jgi:carbon monoxide dehydrogenase subunit G
MINLTVSTKIYRPIRQVFDFVSKPENDFQWQYGTLASTRLAGGVSTIGSFFRSIGHLMGRRVLGTYEVTDFEPDRKYGFKSLSGPMNSQTSYTFEIANGSTKVNMSTQANLVNFFQMDERIVEKKMKKQIKENLAMLKDLLETMSVLPVS